MSPAPFVRWFDGRRPWLRAGIVLAATLGIASLDALTGPDLSLSVLYLLPVALVAWSAGRALGFGTSVLCAACWGTVNHVLAGFPLGIGLAAWNSGVRLLFFLIVASSLDALRQAYRREAVLARTDALTGVLNVRGFREAAELLLARVRRTREPVVVMAMDLDDFKVVNDRSGHEEGDRLLALVGDHLRSRFRRTDVVGRLGGDEFAALLPNARADDAHRLLGSLAEALKERFEQEGWPTGTSVGWVAFETPPATLDDALRAADRRLYEAKESGKSRVVGGSSD